MSVPNSCTALTLALMGFATSRTAVPSKQGKHMEEQQRNPGNHGEQASSKVEIRETTVLESSVHNAVAQHLSIRAILDQNSKYVPIAVTYLLTEQNSNVDSASRASLAASDEDTSARIIAKLKDPDFVREQIESLHRLE